MTEVLVPPVRIARWVENFGARHVGATLELSSGTLAGRGADGASFTAQLPFGRLFEGPAEVSAVVSSCVPPTRWGLLLVRKGGFAVARLSGAQIEESKVGQRHVQSRTKAGGQSQQRFARRRENQARVAYEAAAEHAHRILTGPVTALVCGGDRNAVAQVLDDPRLRHLAPLTVAPWLAVPDPRRAVLDQAVVDGSAVLITISDPVRSMPATDDEPDSTPT